MRNWSKREAHEASPEKRSHYEVIEVTLARPEEMFSIAPADHFSEFRNFMTGLEYSISVLRGRRSFKPVLIEVRLPADQVTDDVEGQLYRTMERYCDHRINYNRRETRAIRLDGLSSFKVGIPLAFAGAALALVRSRIFGIQTTSEIAGGVVMWVGIWFPLDTTFFTPLAFSRENVALRRLRTATFVVVPIEGDL